MIYFDNAATSIKKPDSVIKAVAFSLSNMANAGRGLNTAASFLYSIRKKVANFFNVQSPDNIAFTYNSTESLNIAIKSLLNKDVNKNSNVVTTHLEHNSVLRPLYEFEDRVEIKFVSSDEFGNPVYEEFEKIIDENTNFVICTHASNLTGNLVDIERIGKICKEKNTIFIVDASQTAGIFDIDVINMNIDILCFTGHKSLLAPQGVGGIYINPEIKIKSLKSGGTGIDTYSKKQPDNMPNILEAGTLNMHGLVGLGASIDYINEYGIDKIREKELELMWLFYDSIKDIEGIKIYGDFRTSSRCPIVSLNINDVDSTIIGEDLFSNFDVLIRTGGHCAPLMHKHFKTVKQGMLRFSFSHFNTKEEVIKVIEIIKNIIGDYR